MAKITISDVEYLRRQVKNYLKPFRFTLTLWWQTPAGEEMGVDIKGCVAGRDSAGVPEWRPPLHRAGAYWQFTVVPSGDLYKTVQGALESRGYFGKAEDILDWVPVAEGAPKDQKKAIPAADYGLEAEFNVEV